ncbi:MAG: GTPase [Propionibacteriaceae bacterium]|nr:GTPase [Propionibacteriaceae bacterium]
MSQPRRTLILGSAGRDFHVFNTLYREDPTHDVLGFTAADLPTGSGGRYPACLTGPLYPGGIPILPESRLEQEISALAIEEVVFAYSELGSAEVLRLAARVLAAGADFQLLSPLRSMLATSKPVIAVTAARSGAGKSPTVRYLAALIAAWGLRVAVVRHPVRAQSFAEDREHAFAVVDGELLDSCARPTREPYGPVPGAWVFSGLDYAAILAEAEDVADVILWDGVGNDLPFLRPRLHIVLTDPLQAGEEADYFPGEVGLRLADVVVITKCDSASIEQIEQLESGVGRINPEAAVLTADSPVLVEGAANVAGRTVVVVEEVHSLHLGGLKPGAGLTAARQVGVSGIISPMPQAVGSLAAVYRLHPEAQSVLPVPGFSAAELAEVKATIEATPSEAIINATRLDLAALLGVDRPMARARYALSPHDPDQLAGLVWAAVGLTS